jgi:putative Mn2+ efflux pump MntP
MLDITVTLILVVLSLQVFPVALGIDFKKRTGQALWFAFLLVIGQVLMFLIGFFLGQRFMHLMEDFKGTVIFIGFFIIGLRLIVDAFKVRKGERTYTFEVSSQVALAALAQGINTFLAGLLFTYLPYQKQWLIIVLTLASFGMATLGIVVRHDKTGFSLASLLFLLGGIWMIFSSVYLGFFI